MGDNGICSRQEKVQSQSLHLPISFVHSCITLTLWSSQYSPLITAGYCSEEACWSFSPIVFGEGPNVQRFYKCQTAGTRA